MSTFVAAVRNGAITQPTQRGFSIPKWKSAFDATDEPSPQDRGLYETGLWAFAKLESIRHKLEPTWLSGLSKREHLLMFLGVANRACLLLSEATTIDSAGLVIAEQLVQAKINQPSGLGAASPDALLLSSVDSLRFPLKRIYADTKTSAEASAVTELETIGRIVLSGNLAQLYSIIEGYWMHAVWNGWYIDSTTFGDADLMRPPISVLPIVAAVSQYRREKLRMESSFLLAGTWAHRLSDQEKERLISNLPKVTVRGKGDQRRFAVEPRNETDSVAMMMIQNVLHAERGYYRLLAK